MVGVCFLPRFPVPQAFDRLQKLVYIIFQIIEDPNFMAFMGVVVILLAGFAFGFHMILVKTSLGLQSVRNPGLPRDP
eukprot:SAG11_NODE_5454_length_1555_cov_1.333791_2_plen_77_part_00